MKLIDKDALIAEIKRKIHNIDYEGLSDRNIGQKQSLYHILSFLDTLEVKEVDLNDIKSKWLPTEKQLKSLNDMLKYNIGAFDYQKFMEVNTLYSELTKLLDYKTD